MRKGRTSRQRAFRGCDVFFALTLRLHTLLVPCAALLSDRRTQRLRRDVRRILPKRSTTETAPKDSIQQQNVSEQPIGLKRGVQCLLEDFDGVEHKARADLHQNRLFLCAFTVLCVVHNLHTTREPNEHVQAQGRAAAAHT